MSIRPRLGVEVPELTARVARASNPAGTTAMWVRDRLAAALAVPWNSTRSRCAAAIPPDRLSPIRPVALVGKTVLGRQ